MSVEEYLQGELASHVRHEYVNGNVDAIVGGSERRGLITANLGGLLNVRLPDACQVFIANMKSRISTQEQEIFYYPDILVSCDERDPAIPNVACVGCALRTRSGA